MELVVSELLSPVDWLLLVPELMLVLLLDWELVWVPEFVELPTPFDTPVEVEVEVFVSFEEAVLLLFTSASPTKGAPPPLAVVILSADIPTLEEELLEVFVPSFVVVDCVELLELLLPLLID